tara:strand:- start:508 stop:1302 length:795 start_codon:yes stop_codon:yes gene_type:complete
MQENCIVSTWNVNSIRARLPLFKNWLKKKNPDIVLLQETKAREKDFPFKDLEDFNYNIITNGQKSYNGVAIMSKFPISDIKTEFADLGEGLPQARYIEGWIDNGEKGIRVASIYAPNGNPINTEKYQYKLNWLSSLAKYLKNLINLEEICLLGGDFNICPSQIDCANENSIKNDAIYQKEVKDIFKEILNYGYFDSFRCLNEFSQGFTYWDYGSAFSNNLGVRIDHFLMSSYALDKCKKVYVDTDPRKETKPSDHAPLTAELTL